MSDIVAWILALVSAVLLIGMIGALIAFVVGLFRDSNRQSKRRRKSNKKKRA